MAAKLLDSGALSALCGSVATMLSAGLQIDEAVHLLAENREESRFKTACVGMYRGLIAGESLSQAMEATGAFPGHVIDMVQTGEQSGRLESVLRTLEVYYGEEDRTFQKIRSSVAYPAALLCIMAIILAATVVVILPVFANVYESTSGSLTAASSSMALASIVIGWVAFVITVACAIVAIFLFAASRTQSGRERVLAIFERIPSTRQAMYELALSRFTSALATYIAAGITTETAMRQALETVRHGRLRARLEYALEAMEDLENPRSLPQAFTEADILDPLYAHMLTAGAHAGSVDDVLADLSVMLFDDSTAQLDRALDRIEPLLAALLTIAVGGTLISVMLPLISIMGSIG